MGCLSCTESENDNAAQCFSDCIEDRLPLRGEAIQDKSKKGAKISIRLPQYLAEKLSQVWHERGLAHSQGKLPNGHVREKQEIIAEALQEWMEKRGYLP
jgi:hypothetical protein